MIQVAICDDESLVAHQLESIIWDTCNSAGIKVDTEVYNSGFALEKGILTGQKFDLIYLDIQMKNGDGISTARNIRKMDENVIIIFVSSYDKYMMELFRLDVFAFIKKPIEQDAVYGAQRPLFRFRTAAFRNQTVVLPQSSIQVNGKG